MEPSHATVPVAPNPQVALAYGPPITLAEAKRVMVAAEAEALAHGWPMVIAIVDAAGHVVMVHRMDHAQLGSLRVAEQKARTALEFRRPTKTFEQGIAQGGIGLRVLSMPDVSALEGGIPLVRGGQVIGAIGVSGMLPTQDGQVAEAGARVINEA